MLGAAVVALVRRPVDGAPPAADDEGALPAADEAPPASDDGGVSADLRPARRWPAVVVGALLALVLVWLIAVGLAGPVAARPNLAALVFGVALAPSLVVAAVLGGDLVAWLRPPRPAATEVHPAAPAWAAPALAVPFVLLRTAARLGGREVAVLVLAYLVATTVGRLRCGPGWWRDGDAVAVLVRALARLSPVERHEHGWRRRPWAAGLRVPLVTAERAVLGVVLAGALARAATWLPAIARTSSALPTWGSVLLDLGLFGYGLALLLVVDHVVRRATGATVSVGLVPLTAALLLANDVAGAIYTVDLSLTLLSDPFGTGADLFGTAARRTSLEVLSSPVTWAAQLLLVLGGAVLGAAAQHRFDERVAADAAPAGAWTVAGLGAVAFALVLAG